MSFQQVLMDTLKNRFTETVGAREFGGVSSPTQAQYYLARVEYNLLMPMSEQHTAEYSRGSGNELLGKMKSLRSSSAMTFNLLGNGPVAVKGDLNIPAGTYAVEFEHQLPTLAGNPNPANLDAKMTSEDGKTFVYCEMKLAEWILNKASGLRSQYFEAESYLISKSEAETFISVLKALATDKVKSGRHVPVLDRYDAFQMVKHLLAIYTECIRLVKVVGSLPERIVLANCVWEMEHPEKLERYEAAYREREAEEHEQYHCFAEIVKPAIALFETLGCEFVLRYYSFSEFLALLELKPQHRSMLNRYIV